MTHEEVKKYQRKNLWADWTVDPKKYKSIAEEAFKKKKAKALCEVECIELVELNVNEVVSFWEDTQDCHYLLDVGPTWVKKSAYQLAIKAPELFNALVDLVEALELSVPSDAMEPSLRQELNLAHELLTRTQEETL